MTGQHNPILVLDDDRDLLRLISRTLEHKGWEVRTACNAQQALACCREQKPSMLFVDLMLPHTDGEEFIRTIRELWGPDTPPIVVVSASAVRDEVAERMGVAACLPKPFALEDLSALAETLCGLPHPT